MITTELFDLSGKMALLTGASKGMGQAMAEALANAGARLVLASRTRAEVEAVAAEIAGQGGSAEAFQFDATQPNDAETLVAFAVERFGRLDIFGRPGELGNNLERNCTQCDHHGCQFYVR